jgi:hypothetical protein
VKKRTGPSTVVVLGQPGIKNGLPSSRLCFSAIYRDCASDMAWFVFEEGQVYEYFNTGAAEQARQIANAAVHGNYFNAFVRLPPGGDFLPGAIIPGTAELIYSFPPYTNAFVQACPLVVFALWVPFGDGTPGDVISNTPGNIAYDTSLNSLQDFDARTTIQNNLTTSAIVHVAFAWDCVGPVSPSTNVSQFFQGATLIFNSPAGVQTGSTSFDITIPASSTVTVSLDTSNGPGKSVSGSCGFTYP